MPPAFLTLPGSMIVAGAQSPITLYGAPAAAASRLSPASRGARGAGRSHAVPNMATDTSVRAAISERVLGECMEHLQYWGRARTWAPKRRRTSDSHHRPFAAPASSHDARN